MKKLINVNTVLIGLVAVIAVGLLLWRNMSASRGAYATVNFDDDREPMEISLSKDEIYHIETEKFPVTLQVENGAIRFIDSKCPDHLCEGFGYINHEGETAICMPAGVAVMVIGESPDR